PPRAALARLPPSLPTRRSSDLSEAPLAEFGGVGQHNHLLGGIDHVLVEMSFGYITGSQAMIKVKTVNTYKELAAHHLRQEALSRSEEHTSELQSRENLVCLLLL